MTKTILLLISDPVVLSVIKETLEYAGYYVVTALAWEWPSTD